MINHYSSDLLAKYCAELADAELLDPNRNAYAKNTTTSLTEENGLYTYTVNVEASSVDIANYLKESIYNQTKKIFSENLSYTKVIVTMSVNGENVATYSDDDMLEITKSAVESDLKKIAFNKFAPNTTVEFTEVDGIFTAQVVIKVASTNSLDEHQSSLNDLIKKHFSNINTYVSVDIVYTVNGVQKAHYANGLVY